MFGFGTPKKLTSEQQQKKILTTLKDQIDFAPILDAPDNTSSTYRLDMNEEVLSKINPQHDYRWLLFATTWTKYVVRQKYDQVVVDAAIQEYATEIFTQRSELPVRDPAQFLNELTQSQQLLEQIITSFSPNLFNEHQESYEPWIQSTEFGLAAEFIFGSTSNRERLAFLGSMISWESILSNMS